MGVWVVDALLTVAATHPKSPCDDYNVVRKCMHAMSHCDTGVKFRKRPKNPFFSNYGEAAWKEK